MDKDVVRKVCNVIQNVLEVEITNDTHMDDVPEWDSYGQVAILSALEVAFNVKLSYNDMVEMDSVESIVNVINKIV